MTIKTAPVIRRGAFFEKQRTDEFSNSSPEGGGNVLALALGLIGVHPWLFRGSDAYLQISEV